MCLVCSPRAWCSKCVYRKQNMLNSGRVDGGCTRIEKAFIRSPSMPGNCLWKVESEACLRIAPGEGRIRGHWENPAQHFEGGDSGRGRLCRRRRVQRWHWRNCAILRSECP